MTFLLSLGDLWSIAPCLFFFFFFTSLWQNLTHPQSLSPPPGHWWLVEKNHPTLKNGATERSQPLTSCNSSVLHYFSGQLSLPLQTFYFPNLQSLSLQMEASSAPCCPAHSPPSLCTTLPSFPPLHLCSGSYLLTLLRTPTPSIILSLPGSSTLYQSLLISI